MPKQGTRAEVNTFVKGLITEASPLNFPANASLDEVNFELLRNGTRRRRLGMKRETTSFYASGINTNALSNYVWTGAGDVSSVEFVVVQVGNVLSFLDLTNGVTSSSLVGTLTLTKYPSNKKFSFSTVEGMLVVAGGATVVYVVSYDSPTFTLSERVLKVRDVWGVEESDATTEEDYTFRPDTLTETHKYNLQNQSWGIPRKDKNGGIVDPVQYYKADLNKYPSSSETVWNGLQFQPVEAKNTETPGEVTTVTSGSPGSAGSSSSTTTVNTDGSYTTTTDVAPAGPGTSSTSTSTYAAPVISTEYKDPYERMFNNLYEDRLGADLKAAKGYYIIELLNRGASRLAATNNNFNKFSSIAAATGLKLDYNTSGPSVVCSFAGRMFYSGFDGAVIDGDARSPSLSDYVVFSKLVQSDGDINLCYQEGDPTSRESSDIVDTDGGFISISGAKNIIAMHYIGATMLVFASNGVWSVTGGNDYGFSATNYKVVKLSTFGCVSAESIVVEGTNILYWGKNAIYAVTSDSVGGFQVQDITAESIQTFYDNITESAKETCQGIYHPTDKKVRWVYYTGLLSDSTAITYELVFDTVLKAFYRHTIGKVSDTQVVGIHYSETAGAKYLTAFNGTSFTFSTYSDVTFADWGVIDAKAYLLTGALTAGDNAIAKQVPYVTVHFKRTETGTDSNGVPLNQSSCKMAGRWEWANSVASHKISGLYEVYKYRMPLFTMPNSTFDNGFETVISKNKVRGRGKAISLYFETSPGKDCVLLGWSITLNGNGIT